MIAVSVAIIRRECKSWNNPPVPVLPEPPQEENPLAPILSALVEEDRRSTLRHYDSVEEAETALGHDNHIRYCKGVPSKWQIIRYDTRPEFYMNDIPSRWELLAVKGDSPELENFEAEQKKRALDWIHKRLPEQSDSVYLEYL